MFKLQGGPVSHQRIVTVVKPANEIRVFFTSNQSVNQEL